MALIPQLIKDKEFQVKFRGCDSIEVRDYLEILANEFFELQEQCKEQLAELENFRKAEEASDDYKSSLETDMEFTKKISNQLKENCAQKDQKATEMAAEIEELQLRIADMEQENSERDEEVSSAEARIEEAGLALKAAVTAKESLLNKMDILQQQNQDLKKEEVDFKSTLATAQQFAEDLKEKSKIQAEEMIAEVHAEIKKIRDDANEELERLPREIDVLKKKKGEVKADLKSTLENYLETIDVISPDDDNETVAASPGDTTDSDTEDTEAKDSKDSEADSLELFQKIEIDEDGLLNPEDVEKLQPSFIPALQSENEESLPAKTISKEELDTFLRGEEGINPTEDSYTLADMFSLEIGAEGKKASS